MTSLNFHFWSLLQEVGFEHRDIELHIIEQIKKTDDVREVNIFAAEEIHFSSYEELHELCKSKKIQINYLFGASMIYSYSDYRMQHVPKDKIYTFLWPTFFFRHAYHHMVDYLKEEIEENTFTYPIICLNVAMKRFRCMLVDQLAKHNLIEGNAISWHNVQPEYELEYNWQYWSPKKLTLSEHPIFSKQHTQSIDHSFNQFSVPFEWHHSFLHIVSETAIDMPFITEKTVMPLLYKKLFIVVGSKNFYKGMSNLGFELYNEIFDYSFESISDTQERINSIVDQVSTIVQDPTKFKSIYESIQEKLEKNYNLAMKYATSVHRPNLINRTGVKYYSYLRYKKYYTLSN